MDTMLLCEISTAVNMRDYTAIKTLMAEYRALELGDDYAVGGCGLDEELANLPGPYAPPRGMFLLAHDNDAACGCLALRPISNTSGEVMRMYVREASRGRGVADTLMHTLISRARSIGYKTLYLDSLKRFTGAHRLYEKLGFDYCAPYDPKTTDAMKENMVFMQLAL